MTAQETRPCVVCKQAIPQGDPSCRFCGSEQFLKLCVICRDAIPLRANRCNKCQAYQDGRSHLSLSAALLPQVTALIAVLSTLVTVVASIRDYDSHTRLMVTGSDEVRILVQAWNTGERPSRLVRYRLKFGKLPIDEIELHRSGTDDFKTNIILPGKDPVQVGLIFPRKLTLADDKIKNRIDNESLVLEVDVEESNDPGRGFLWLFPHEHHTRSNTFQGGLIREFLTAKMP